MEKCQDFKKMKQKLNKYYWKSKELERLINKKETIRNKMESIRTSNLSGMPKGVQVLTIDDLLIYLDQCMDEINQSISIQRQYLKEIESLIELLEDNREKYILKRHYIDFLPFILIADELSRTERHVQRIHNSAINNLISLCHEMS